MNSTKSALLKRHYKRQRMILNAKRLVIQTGSLRRSQFILDQSYKLAGLLPTFGFDSAKGKDKMGISIISGQRIKKTQDYRIATAEEAEFEEVDLSKWETFLRRIGESNFSFFVKLALSISTTILIWWGFTYG